MRILFLVPYPEGAAASQRFRFEQYFAILKESGHSYKISEFLDAQAWAILYRKGHLIKKIFGILRGFIRRTLDMFSLGHYDFIFIHREAAPFGPPVFEWLISKVFKKKIIYDFDDAIWIPNSSASNTHLSSLFKCFSNVKKICSWATTVSVGNKFLMDYALQYSSHVILNPTTIDTDQLHNTTTEHTNSKFIFGWTGSHSTLQYLDIVFPILEELEKTVEFELHVVCDVAPEFKLKSLKFIPWKKDTEIRDLLNFNVGLMPLTEDVWSNGKCGFKALQYMSLGIPAIVSDVGVNAEVVDHEVNGCVCKSKDDWNKYMLKLIREPLFLKGLASKTRKKIIDNYSVQSNKQNFLSLFEDK